MDLSALQNKCRDLHLAQLCDKLLFFLLASLTVDLNHDGGQRWEVTARERGAEEVKRLIWKGLKKNPDSLKHEWLPPEEDILHELAACLCVQDPVEVDLTEVLLLGLKIAGLHHPDGKLGVQSTQMITVRSPAVVKANSVCREGGKQQWFKGQGLSFSEEIGFTMLFTEMDSSYVCILRMSVRICCLLCEPLVQFFLGATGTIDNIAVRDYPEAGVTGGHTLVHR